MRGRIRRPLTAAAVAVAVAALLVWALGCTGARRGVAPAAAAQTAQAQAPKGQATEARPVSQRPGPRIHDYPLRAAPARFSLVVSHAPEADLGVVVEVLDVGETGGHVRVLERLLGPAAGEPLDVYSPPYEGQLAVGWEPLAAGDRAVLFLKRDGDRYAVVGQGMGSQKLPAEGAAAEIESIRRVVEIIGRPEPAAIEAMFAAAQSGNTRLQTEAHYYLLTHLREAATLERYWPQVQELLGSDDREPRLTALDLLMNRRMAQAAPDLLRATHDPDRLVAQRAVTDLRWLNTPEVVARVVELADSPDANLRASVPWVAANLTQPEVLAAARRLLDDADGRVRRAAVYPYVLWLKAGVALDAIPKLVALFDDPEPGVGSDASQALGYSKRVEAVAPLLDVLRQKPPDAEAYRLALEALYPLATIGPGHVREQLTANLDLFTTILAKQGENTALSAAGILSELADPEARAALEQAAQNHPEAKVRERCARLLQDMAAP